MPEITGKKRMGRPLIADKPRNKRIEITVDEDTKLKLQSEKKRTGKSISQIIIELVEAL